MQFVGLQWQGDVTEIWSHTLQMETPAHATAACSPTQQIPPPPPPPELNWQQHLAKCVLSIVNIFIYLKQGCKRMLINRLTCDISCRKQWPYSCVAELGCHTVVCGSAFHAVLLSPSTSSHVPYLPLFWFALPGFVVTLEPALPHSSNRCINYGLM